ncbi:MAG TPA: hypothetical protein VN228_22075 [Pyrinomonadaceae bacterium]|nr:hypothetical protein [Pyrinomonadaceae bacterium]
MPHDKGEDLMSSDPNQPRKVDPSERTGDSGQVDPSEGTDGAQVDPSEGSGDSAQVDPSEKGGS